jgi:hypothetical protein
MSKLSFFLLTFILAILAVAHCLPADIGVNLSPLSPLGEDGTYATAWVFLDLMKVCLPFNI